MINAVIFFKTYLKHLQITLKVLFFKFNFKVKKKKITQHLQRAESKILIDQNITKHFDVVLCLILFVIYM